METEFNFFAIIDETTTTTKSKSKSNTKVVYYTNPNEVIIFGNFTLEECCVAQCVPINRHSVNYPLHPLYFRQPIPCSRCGYFSHVVEKCVAKRNYYGELIHSRPFIPTKKHAFKMYPSSPVSAHNEIHYYNNHLIKNRGCDGDNTDYNQFVFTSDDICDWIEEQEQNTLFVPPHHLTTQAEPVHVVYVPVIINNHPPRYAPIVMPSSDQDIEYMLRYNYAMTGYMLERQVARVY